MRLNNSSNLRAFALRKHKMEMNVLRKLKIFQLEPVDVEAIK